jgi:hypothetical protein
LTHELAFGKIADAETCSMKFLSSSLSCLLSLSYLSPARVARSG